MFFNAMRRKGFSPKEEDMRIVVAIHNTVNEKVTAQMPPNSPTETMESVHHTANGTQQASS